MTENMLGGVSQHHQKYRYMIYSLEMKFLLRYFQRNPK